MLLSDLKRQCLICEMTSSQSPDMYHFRVIRDRIYIFSQLGELSLKSGLDGRVLRAYKIKTIKKDSYKEAYQALIRFVDQSLDSTRAELSQLLYPCFAHFYLKLMINGHEEMARKFYDEFSKGFEVGNC